MTHSMFTARKFASSVISKGMSIQPPKEEENTVAGSSGLITKEVAFRHRWTRCLRLVDQNPGKRD